MLKQTECMISFSELLIIEVVDCFVVGHWAVSSNKVTERHVSRPAKNMIEVQKSGRLQPEGLYQSHITTFSQEGSEYLNF